MDNAAEPLGVISWGKWMEEEEQEHQAGSWRRACAITAALLSWCNHCAKKEVCPSTSIVVLSQNSHQDEVKWPGNTVDCHIFIGFQINVP